jgi:hypothetical protein
VQNEVCPQLGIWVVAGAVDIITFEIMFDDLLTDADDSTVVAAIAESTRAEAAAAASRLAAIAELVTRHADGPTDCAQWSCDNWDAIAAEVAAAQNISHAMASGQMYLAVALRNRLPAVAKLFANGIISTRLATAIVYCGKRIRPGTPWHLAHSDRADAHALHLYAGPAHAKCNNATNKRRQPRLKPARALAFFDTSKPATSNTQQTLGTVL